MRGLPVSWAGNGRTGARSLVFGTGGIKDGQEVGCPTEDVWRLGHRRSYRRIPCPYCVARSHGPGGDCLERLSYDFLGALPEVMRCGPVRHGQVGAGPAVLKSPPPTAVFTWDHRRSPSSRQVQPDEPVAVHLTLDGDMLQGPLSSRRTVSRSTVMSNGLPTTAACAVLSQALYAPVSCEPVTNTTAGRGGDCRSIAR
jgi:hypothetical protein